VEERIASLVDQMTLDEQVTLTAGMDNWRVDGIPRLGIGRIKMSDGPTGVRGDLTSGVSAVNFPIGSALGASWDVDLVAEVATTLADEAASKGAHVVLGPTVNLHRYPLAGRNFECYSEDPELTAQLAISFITALQSGGVGASLKHFVCNDQEHERHSISAQVDERTLREVYLRPFEAAVTGSAPWTIMAAYNRLDGEFCSQNDRLLNQILKGEWNYDGVVVSDWYGTHETEAAAAAGLDIQMPGPPLQFGPPLAESVRTGSVAEADVIDKATRVVRLAARTGRLDDTSEPAERAVDTPERDMLARRAARSSMVLLSNDGVLPLDAASLGSVAVIGPNATPGQSQGGGSSQVLPHHVVSPLDGLSDRFGDVTYERGVGLGMFAAPIDPGLLGDGYAVEYFDDPDSAGDPFHTEDQPEARFSFFGSPIPRLGQGHFSARWTARFTPDQSGRWELSLAAAGQARVRIDGQVVVDDWDEPGPTMLVFPNELVEQRGSVELIEGEPVDLLIELRAAKRGVLPHMRFGAVPPDPDTELNRAVEAARTAEIAIVVVGTSPDFETEGEDRKSFSLPGRQNDLVTAIAAAQPNTVVVVNAGSAAPMPWAHDVRAVLWTWYPGQEFGVALAEVLSGEGEPGGRLPSTIPYRIEDSGAHASYPGTNGEVTYDEGVFIGHRWFDEHDIEPQFCFGHGLSYTTFEYSDLHLHATEDEVPSVSVAITNVGERRGSEVVQLYVHDVESSVPRPPRELKAFTKVHLLPGETRRESFSLGPRSFAFYDVETSGWKVEPGDYEIQVGSSSRDIRVTGTITL